MPHPVRVSAWLPAYRQDLRDALQAATGDGFQFIRANTVGTPLNPAEFSRSARRHLARHLEGLGLRLDGLSAEFGGRGLADPHDADRRLDHLRRTLELCADLRVRFAAVDLSGFSDERQRDLAHEMLDATADLADRFGLRLAIHAAGDPPDQVAAAVRRLSCPNVALELDTATLAGPAESLGKLADLTDSLHLRDARRRGGQIEEVPLGRGDVDLPAILAALAVSERPDDRTGAGVSLVVRRDRPDRPVDALRADREYVHSLLAGRAGR